ncbi:MAG: sigma-70 family RNA polymerase sigma factor [Thermodesulfovibrionales bacterium]
MLLILSQEEGETGDDGIVAAVRGGDIDSFGALVSRHEKKMLNIAFRMIGSYEDACEVVQDAFVSAYRNLGAFEGRSKFSTWLASIVINLSRNRIQQLASHSGREAYSLDEPEYPDTGRPPRDAASTNPSALDEMERKDVQEAVRRCLGRLEAGFREMIVLRDLQGFSYSEIGAALNLAEGTVKSRIFRARETMKNCLKKLLGHGER